MAGNRDGITALYLGIVVRAMHLTYLHTQRQQAATPGRRVSLARTYRAKAVVAEPCLIAIVDDDEDVREATKGLMRSLGFVVEAFSSGEDFLRSPSFDRTACLVADINMPGMSGLELHRQVSRLNQSIPTILITGHPSDSGRQRALDAGVLRYLTKPFSEEELLGSVHLALARHGNAENE
jgi:FixJ family two-component response regulator